MPHCGRGTASSLARRGCGKGANDRATSGFSESSREVWTARSDGAGADPRTEEETSSARSDGAGADPRTEEKRHERGAMAPALTRGRRKLVRIPAIAPILPDCRHRIG